MLYKIFEENQAIQISVRARQEMDKVLEKNKNRKEIGIEMLFATICTVLFFSIYLGQYLFSDVVTFAKNGDQDKLCFAAFAKLCQMFTGDFNLIGIDNGSANGASEFFLRPNLPNLYIPLYLFAWLSKIFPMRAMYLMFYALHMLIALAFIQRVAKKYFNLNRNAGFVIVALFSSALRIEVWYISFYIIVALVPILLFFSLESIYNRSLKNQLLCVLCVILSLTSGYMTLSLALVAIDVLFVLIFYNVKEGKLNIKKSIHFLIYPAIGGSICLIYYLQVFEYIKKVVQSPMNFASAVYYKMALSDILNIACNSLKADSTIEQLELIVLGAISCLILAIGVWDKVFDKMQRHEKWICYTSFGLYTLVLLWACESSLPFSAWFFSLVPILGGMHIPLRYLMIIMPFVYISILLVSKYTDYSKYRKVLKIIGVIVAGMLGIYLIQYKRIGVQEDSITNTVNSDMFIFEVLLFIGFLYQLLRKGIKKFATMAVWCIAVFVPSVAGLYQATETYLTKEEIEQRSIIYDESAMDNIDNYIAMLDEKEIYRFVAYDSAEDVPVYLLGNYEWYGYSNYNICNYSGYEMHLGVPLEYRQRMPWFNQIDWEYAVDTRADFAMFDLDTLRKNETLQKIIDTERGIEYVGNGRYICALNKYIPSVIAGEKYVYDDRESLDNGYFYSYNLTDENIKEFNTDGNSFYKMQISAQESSVIMFLPYANRNYVYYVDGMKIQPEIYDTHVIFRVEAGEHIIEVKYENQIGKISVVIIWMSVVLLIISVLAIAVIDLMRKHRSYKKEHSC